MKINFRLLLGGLLVVAVLAGLQVWQGLQNNTASLASKPTGANFTLQSIDGDFSLSDLEDDQLALIYFGYTWCPDICPMSMVFLEQAMQELPANQRRQLQPLFISVDPDRDTPERLASYVDFFDADILGLTHPDEDYLEELARSYGAFFRKVELDSAMGYALDHTSEFYLANNQGELLATLPHSSNAEQLRTTLTSALEGLN